MNNIQNLQQGAFQIINNCLKVQRNEKIVIITDSETEYLALAIKDEAQKISENIKLFKMEDFGQRDEKNPLRFPSQIKNALLDADVSIYCAQGKNGELQSFRSPMINTINSNKNLRHAHMPGINSLLMETGMMSNYKEIAKLSKKLYNTVKNAKQIKVTSPAGTDFIATFSPDIKWLIADGDIRKGSWKNLPDGEVYTCIKDMNGKVVIDGVLGDHYDEKYGLIEKTPLILKIENGRILKVECENKNIEDDIRKETQKDENSNRIGEFAIGTNFEIKELVGNMLQDEKFPGIHIAIGHGYPKDTGSNWDSETHIDAVIKKPTIKVDGKIIMQDGKFIF